MTCLPPSIKTHPLYPLRSALVLASIPSLFFATISIIEGSNYGSYQNNTPFLFHLMLAAASAVINIYELARWGMAKSHDPDNEPKYPLKRMLAADVLLAAAFGLFVFPTELGEAGGGSCYSAGRIAASYASVACLVAFILHTVCAWKQLMALKKKEWEKEAAQESDAVESGNSCAHYQRTRCPDCGAKGLWYRDVEAPYGERTPMSGGGLDVTTGYEIIPDKLPDTMGAVKGKKAKCASRLNSQTSLMEV